MHKLPSNSQLRLWMVVKFSKYLSSFVPNDGIFIKLTVPHHVFCYKFLKEDVPITTSDGNFKRVDKNIVVVE